MVELSVLTFTHGPPSGATKFLNFKAAGWLWGCVYLQSGIVLKEREKSGRPASKDLGCIFRLRENPSLNMAGNTILLSSVRAYIYIRIHVDIDFYYLEYTIIYIYGSVVARSPFLVYIETLTAVVQIL